MRNRLLPFLIIGLVLAACGSTEPVTVVVTEVIEGTPQVVQVPIIVRHR
jgi:hypothetical protein